MTYPQTPGHYATETSRGAAVAMKGRTLIFKLSMPNVASWNGRWSGAEKCYAIVKKFGRGKRSQAKVDELLEFGSWYHNFGDGWGASVSVSAATPEEARKIRKVSSGFYGYDWMVTNILLYGSTREPSKQGNPMAVCAMGGGDLANQLKS